MPFGAGESISFVGAKTMEISTSMLLNLRLLAPLLVISAVVVVSVMKYRRSLTHPQSSAVIVSTLILNSAVQLPSRSLTGTDGLIIVLDLVTIVAGLVGLHALLWRAESKGPNKTLNPDAG